MPPKLPDVVDPVLVTQKVVLGVFNGVKTTELDNLAAETAAYMSTTHPGMFEILCRSFICFLRILNSSLWGSRCSNCDIQSSERNEFFFF
jgi:hypothetical protein